MKTYRTFSLALTLIYDAFVFIRYVAIRKPIRYEVIQTRTRVQCWVAVSWVSALMLCCPPLMGFRGADYDKEAAVCLLEWNVMPAYAATLASLILGEKMSYFY